MKFSYQWLCELTPGLSTDPKTLQRLITMKTAECEGIEPFGAHFTQVVAARVIGVEPTAKGKNKLVQIDVGSGKRATVLCGAPNLREGMLAPWVPPGTSLEGKTIGRAVMDGVESEGMLASAAELGINRDHSGLLELFDVQPGQPLSALVPDWIIEIDNKSLTHRPDLWGHVGMAREVAVITGLRLFDPVKINVLPHCGDPAVHVEIANHDLCPRYSALVLENISIEPSPLWLQARLESIGLNAINNIVDVTNFALAELPQPMHAFDADKLQGNTIYVRTAHPGEILRALNDETYELTTADLVIADAAGPIALAGVIGGADSAISETTRRVVLESANFQATSVRQTSARHKLRTDASMRFEKSLDPENTLRGLARALEIVHQVSPGVTVRGSVTDNFAPLKQQQPVALPMSFVVGKLGKEISQQQVVEILDALGFQARETAPGLLTVTIPTWRATKDIGIKDDLVEEIGRIIGYDEITPAPPLVASIPPYQSPMRQYLRTVRTRLVNQGFTEVYNYSFVAEADMRRFGRGPEQHIAVRNPIASEQTHLRRSLLPGIYRTIVNNVRHYSEFRIFEIGNEIHPDASPNLPDEIPHAVAALYGAHADERDFFELKRVLECVLPDARVAASASRSHEHPVRAAEVHWRGSVVGRIFELQPSLLADEGIKGRAVLFDIDLRLAQQLSAAAQEVTYTPVRKYPTSGFDLSVVTALEKPVAQIQDDLVNFAGPELAAIEFIRQYDGSPLDAGQKSVSYHLEIGALDHTLTSEEGEDIRSRIIEGMRSIGYEFRG
ncbi:MAG TPA: phenylalanine--tRNA ligase subunit beta [Bryobacteraceae bacterium]|nr:phenylalanine--tRNA ligase subunit beta [Bryobacteraceae bacterium]